MVSHSTLPVARLSASISPAGATPLGAASASTDFSVESVSGRSIVARYTDPSAVAMSVSTPPNDPGSNV